MNSKLETPIFKIAGHWQLILGVIITTISWVTVTLITKPTKKETLDKFDSLIFEGEDKFKNIGSKIIAFISGTIGVYSFLFATGNWIYGKIILASGLSVLTAICIIILLRVWKKIN